MACCFIFAVPLKSSISQVHLVAELAQGRGEGCVMDSIPQLTAYGDSDPLTLHQGKLLALARQGENAPGAFFELFSSCCSLFEDYISSKCNNRGLFLCPCQSHQGHLAGRKAFSIKCRELLPSYRSSLCSFYFHFFY